MSEVFFAYTNSDELRDEYFLLEDDVVYEDDACVIGCSPSRFAKDETTVVAIFGEVFNIDEFGYDIEKYTDAEIILKLLETDDPEDFFCDFAGSFAVFVYERDLKEWMLITDVFGDYYPFYYVDDDEFIISMNLGEFNSTLFDISPSGINHLLHMNNFKTVETPIDGVYKLSEGSILTWPNQKVVQYIDVREDLEHAYNNKIDIELSEAIEYIDTMLRKTVEVTSRNYDKSKIGVEFTYGIDGIVAASTLNVCGIIPIGYLPVFPIQERLGHWTGFEDKKETEKRRRAIKRLHDKLNLTKSCNTVVFNYDDIDEYLTDGVVKNPHTASQWGSVLFHNNKIGKMARQEGISCLYNESIGHVIFLNRLEYYIFYRLTRNNITEISIDEIYEMFQEVIYDSSNYSFNCLSSLKREIEMLDDGFVNYIISSMNIVKTNLSDRDSRLAWGVPRISIYKNLRLWKFVLSLPDNIIDKSSTNAILQKGIIEKQTGIDNIRWNLNKWKSFSYRAMSMFDKKVDKTPRKIPTLIRHTEKTKADWDEATSAFHDKGVDINAVWPVSEHKKNNPDTLDTRSVKILLIYYWFKEWIK